MPAKNEQLVHSRVVDYSRSLPQIESEQLVLNSLIEIEKQRHAYSLTEKINTALLGLKAPDSSLQLNQSLAHERGEISVAKIDLPTELGEWAVIQEVVPNSDKGVQWRLAIFQAVSNLILNEQFAPEYGGLISMDFTAKLRDKQVVSHDLHIFRKINFRPQESVVGQRVSQRFLPGIASALMRNLDKIVRSTMVAAPRTYRDKPWVMKVVDITSSRLVQEMNHIEKTKSGWSAQRLTELDYQYLSTGANGATHWEKIYHPYQR